MNNRIGFLAGLDFANLPVPQVASTLAGLGYKAVSWPLKRFDPYTTTASERIELLRACGATGLEISEWVLQDDYIVLDPENRKKRIEHSLDTLRVLAKLGTSAPVNLFTGPAPWNPNAPRLGCEIEEGTAWAMLCEAFDVLVPAAEQLGMRLAVEGVFGHLVHDYYTSLELLRRYFSPNLGVNFDPSHGTLYGNDVAWAVHQLGPKIFHVHLKDAAGKPGGLPGETFIFPLLGEGKVNWKAFFTALDQVGYRGFMTVEFEAFDYYKNVLRNDPAAAAKLSMELVERLSLP